MRAQIGRRDLGPGARALNDQRVITVATRGKAHHIVGESDVRKRMLGVQMREANGSLAVCLDAADVSEYLLLFRSAGER